MCQVSFVTQENNEKLLTTKELQFQVGRYFSQFSYEYFITSPELDSMSYRGLGCEHLMLAEEDLQPFHQRSENLQCAKLSACMRCIACKYTDSVAAIFCLYKPYDPNLVVPHH